MLTEENSLDNETILQRLMRCCLLISCILLPMSFRIIFCGTPAFACPSLQALHDDPAFEVTQVITQPDKPVGRGKKQRPPPVKELALSLGIPVMQPHDINVARSLWRAESSRGREVESCDFLVVVAYGQILSKEILALPKIAPVNVHASLLPRWRGASPIESSILAGDTETGITIQRMVERLDAGPIFSQERLPIGLRETKVSLTEKLAVLGATLLCETLKKPLHEVLQKKAEATVCKKLTREMGVVEPKTMTAEEIDRRVRALVPWPGVTMDGVKLIETSLEPHPEALVVPCAKKSTLFVLKLQPPTKRVMSGIEWRRGNQSDQ